jgi:Protein of unknown function (DUF3108)
MRHANIARSIVLFLAAVIPGASSDDVHAAALEPGRVSLSYEVYSGGFHLLTVDLDLAMAGQRYGITTRLQTTGFLSWFITWSQVSASEGTILSDAMEPMRHRSEGHVRGRKRTVEIDYDKGQVSAVRVEPPPVEDEERDEVPLAMQREAVDPMSAILGAVQRLSAGRGCHGRLPVFDGRRRYDLVLTDRGRRAMPETRYSIFSGEAVQCDFAYEPIAGHIRRRADPETRDKRGVQSGRVYAAVATGSLVMPVRVEIDGDWGMTVAHLRDVRRVPMAAQ